jgi:hypothetical protein
LRKGDHAITNVTRRKYSIFTAETARATAIIGHGHYGGQIADWLPYIAGIIAAPRNEFF